MRLIRGIPGTEAFRRGCVATVGNFDGVHSGHRKLIEKLAERGRDLNLPVAVMLFEPQPAEYFLGARAPARLYRLREKLACLACMAVDYVVLLRFNETLAELEAEAFIQEILVAALRVRHFVVGDDFRFGKGRRGDFEMLQALGADAGFSVAGTPSVEVDGRRVSSTLIRDALRRGDLDAAARLLGRPYSICGRVVQGARRGRSIGVPTANVRIGGRVTALQGVFAVSVAGLGGAVKLGVANVGTRPTVSDGGVVLLEVHVFNFGEDLYGRRVEVRFHHKIRDEEKFDSIDAMKIRIEDDIVKARDFLERAFPLSKGRGGQGSSEAFESELPG